MSDILTLTYEDYNGRRGTFQLKVQAGLGPANAELLAMVQEHVDLSLCQLVEASLSQAMDISGLTNPVAQQDVGNDSVEEQAAFQGRRTDGGGFTRISVPGPIDTIFVTTGAYAGADVDPTNADVVAFLNAALAATIAGKIWEAPGDEPIDFDKAWRKGRKHS